MVATKRLWIRRWIRLVDSMLYYPSKFVRTVKDNKSSFVLGLSIVTCLVLVIWQVMAIFQLDRQASKEDIRATMAKGECEATFVQHQLSGSVVNGVQVTAPKVITNWDLRYFANQCEAQRAGVEQAEVLKEVK